MSEIVGFSSAPGQTLSLGCEMTDFYPPNITVTWLKLREGERDDREEEVMAGGEMWGPVQTHPRLYRATATLKRKATSQDKKERGGGVMCRVEHCSLQEPIEKQWRSVDIGMNHDTHNSFGMLSSPYIPTISKCMETHRLVFLFFFVFV